MVQYLVAHILKDIFRMLEYHKDKYCVSGNHLSEDNWLI